MLSPGYILSLNPFDLFNRCEAFEGEVGLPRQVVKPLVGLRQVVDRAASGNYLIDFELRGQAEVVELAKSVRKLIAHVQQEA